MNNYTLGLDIGITSVGSCAIDQENGELIELAVRKFDQASEAKDARLVRSARRTLRRKKWRKDQLLKAFNDFDVISEEDISKYGRENYLNYNSTCKDLKIPEYYTVYHLRKSALSGKISKREILLCLYNILQARGHFLFDTVDFSKEGVNYDLFRNRFFELVSQHVSFTDRIDDFEDKVLKKIFESGINSKDLKKTILVDNRFTDSEESDNDLFDLCNIISGRKAKIGRFYNQPEEKSRSIEDLKKSEELNEFQEALVELNDLYRIAGILKDGKEYVCDIAVDEIDKYRKLKEEKADKDEFKTWQGASNGKHVRSYKNLNNSYPNGLYVKEVSAILNQQQKYYPEITDAFIEVCCSIVSARIPYYVGPLGDYAKNGWADKKGKIEYSFDYSKDKINVDNTIRTWKKNMISHCTYLPEETALPKGSLLGEVFSIVNEINNYNCIDKDNNDYYLTREDKIRIFDELFLKKETVTLNDVKELLNLNRYYSQKGNTSRFNNKITVYRQLEKIADKFRIDSIIEIFSNKAKIQQIEDVILDLNLFDEGKFKKEYFINKGYEENQAAKLAEIKINGFYRFSQKFIYETIMNTQGETMLDILFDDNTSSLRNNQQVIVSNATDINGNKIDFLMNKYEKIIRNNNNQLNVDLILDEGKPTIPVSRPVIRALNETFKVYQGYLDIYGIPSRVVVETARGADSIKDFTEQNGSPMKHYNKTEQLHAYLLGQLEEKDKNDAILRKDIADWEELESYYNANRQEIELYIRQDGIDLLTGKPIDINHLENYEIDHILPRGFGDDSQDDKMLTSKLANAKKGDRLPIEFLESEDARSIEAISVGRYVKIVNKLAELKMISDKKQERLLLESKADVEGFINQNLVDTRYIISQFVAMINAYNKVNNLETHVVCLKSSFTDLYRTVLRFNKDRDLGDQHHAYDAACICIADKCLNTYYPYYDQRNNAESRRKTNNGLDKYSEFVSEMEKYRTQDKTDSHDKLRNFIFYAFKKAYGQDIYKLGKEAPLLQAIKSRTPLLSWKIEKNYDGKLFNVTLCKPKEENDTSVLTILNVNDSKRSFDNVYPVAVDFYKIKHKHYAVHIPRIIINEKGEIDKEKYLKLIKEHYKADDLLDEHGELNLKTFRFRAFKHDLIFDTESNICHSFNLGSIANKKLEIQPVNIFSYNSIYNTSKIIRQNIVKDYNLKTRSNKEGISFEDIDKKELTSYLCTEIGLLNNPEKHSNRLYELTKELENIYKYCDKSVYYSYLANNIYATPQFDGRILPTANNNIISKNLDAEYVKIKYNILGVRFSNNEKGKLIIEGPRGYKNGGFKLIKKEEFYWTISRNMLK